MGVTKRDRLDPNKGPKRILSLDGGGIRGVLTLQYLKVIETMVKERFGEETLLCDYFDLIGGTSTGSIIAAGLASGMSVDELNALYTGIGSTVFESKWWSKLRRNGLLAPKFPDGPLKRTLDAKLGAQTTLNSDTIRTGLMIMTKRLDTSSPWPLHDGPGAEFAKQDGALRLTEIVRASTAAPTYFRPQEIRISSRDGSTVDAAFVDGGVSPFNDPALQLLMLAALRGHGFSWQTGDGKLLLISIGTGSYRQRVSGPKLLAMTAAQQGVQALSSLMDDCARSNQAMLQWLTRCLTPWSIDRAVGDMQADSKAGPKLATYARYNVLLEEKWLKDNLALEYGPDKLEPIRKMDDLVNMDEVERIGRVAAARQVKPEHLERVFDIAKAPV